MLIEVRLPRILTRPLMCAGGVNHAGTACGCKAPGWYTQIITMHATSCFFHPILPHSALPPRSFPLITSPVGYVWTVTSDFHLLFDCTYWQSPHSLTPHDADDVSGAHDSDQREGSSTCQCQSSCFAWNHGGFLSPEWHPSPAIDRLTPATIHQSRSSGVAIH